MPDPCSIEGEKAYHRKWRSVEFTDEFPKFYLDYLQNGTDEEKQEAAWKVFTAVHQNNYNARQFKEYENGLGLDVLAAYEREALEKEWNRGSLDMMIGNLLHMLGHPTYHDESKYMKGTGGYFDCLPAPGTGYPPKPGEVKAALDKNRPENWGK